MAAINTGCTALAAAAVVAVVVVAVVEHSQSPLCRVYIWFV